MSSHWHKPADRAHNVARLLRGQVLSGLFGSVILWAASASAQLKPQADLDQGKDLLSHLSVPSTPDSPADQAFFRQIGTDRSEKILMAVVTNGSVPTATSEDWAEMHRAYDALIELLSGEQQLYRASLYAQMQEGAYRRNEGDYTAALHASRQALDLQQRAGQTATLSIPWMNLGNDLIHLGQVDEGARALEQSRKLIQDPTSSLAADLWGQIILLDSSLGKSALAHQESDAFLQAALPSSPALFRAGALLAAANLAVDEHRYDDAIAQIHQALTANKGAPATDALLFAYKALDVLLDIGLEAMQTMPYDQAMALCDRLDKGFKSLPISISDFARGIGNHRRLLAGQFDAVLREDAAQLERARAANDLSGEIAALQSTAVDYAYLRESAQRVAALNEAATLLHTADATVVSPLLRYGVLNSLAAAQLAGGDLRSAHSVYDEVLNGIAAITSAQTRTQLGQAYAEAQLGKAEVIERDGDLKGARDLLQQALNPPSGALGRFTRSTVLLQSARLEQSVGQESSEVVRLYLEAIAALHKEEDFSTEVYARLQLVQYLASRTQPAAGPQTLAMARQQLAIARAASTSVALADSTWRTHFLEGIIDQSSGDAGAAIRAYTAAVDALNRIRGGLSVQEERQSFIDTASVQELYRRQVELLTAGGNRDQAWEFIERNKARSFLETLNGRHFAASAAVSLPGKDKAAAAELSQIEQQILTTRVALSPDSESVVRDSRRTPEVLQARLLTLEASFALARQEKSLADSRATQPLALLPITLAATQARLPAHTALIEYAILDGELAAFVVTHTSATELHWPVDTAALPGQLRKLSRQLATPPGLRDDLDAQLSAASQILVAPIVKVLPVRIDTLIIVPTQSISLIPFQALPLPDRNTPSRGFVAGDPAPPPAVDDPAFRNLLIDRFAISYLPSASTLQFLHFGPPVASPDLFLGAIGDLSVEGWTALPGTLEETAAIQKLYPGATRVTGAAFTHDVAVNALLQHQEVHFATHGHFEEQAPLFSVLITAPEAGRLSRLSLYEVMDLNLKAKLVILSACETDRGQLAGGDEVEGLTRTFLQAGAESVVSSLWNVNDKSTALLMESLHAHLRAGESTPLALRHAELQVRRQFPDPYFWAAFVDSGVR